MNFEEIAQGGRQFGEEVNYWLIARKRIGSYGTDYFQRAVVWHKSVLANQPEESLYPSTFQDSTGQFLDGKSTYQLYFPKDEILPEKIHLTLRLCKNETPGNDVKN